MHRDIKPANIWLEEGRGRVKIVDFGLVRVADDDVHLTGENYMVGTPVYMSPEQAEGDRETEAPSDLFSLGSVLYRMSTGELPFKGRKTMHVLNALANKKPKPPIDLNPQLPRALSDLISEHADQSREVTLIGLLRGGVLAQGERFRCCAGLGQALDRGESGAQGGNHPGRARGGEGRHRASGGAGGRQHAVVSRPVRDGEAEGIAATAVRSF